MKNITINGHEIFCYNREAFWLDVEQGKWEPQSFRVLDKYIKKGKVFIDIGAWNGVLSLYAAKLGAKCYSVEPDKKASEELRENVINNKLYTLITLSGVAISNKNELSNLNSMTKDGLGNSESSLINRGVVAQSVTVATETLETFVRDRGVDVTNICLIKIDTEGSEVLIIEGAKDFLTKYKPTIYISFHPAWFTDKSKAILLFIDVLFPIYKFIGVTTWEKEYSVNDFIAAMGSYHDHSFILIAK